MTKTINAYIVYDLDNWSKSQLGNFRWKKCLSGATNIVKKSDKQKYLYSGYGTVFGGKGLWSFGNNFARNVVIFCVNNSSSSHTDNRINDFLVLDKKDIFSINDKLWCTRKISSVLILVKQR